MSITLPLRETTGVVVFGMNVAYFSCTTTGAEPFTVAVSSGGLLVLLHEKRTCALAVADANTKSAKPIVHLTP